MAALAITAGYVCAENPALAATPVVCRATQLGGRFMMLRREAKAVASMQHRMSGEPGQGGCCLGRPRVASHCVEQPSRDGILLLRVLLLRCRVAGHQWCRLSSSSSQARPG